MSVSESLQRLRAIRRGHRSAVTRATNEINTILSTSSLSNESLTRLNILKQHLDAKQKTLNELDGKILAEIKVEDIEKEIEETEVIIVAITETKEKIEQATRAYNTNTNTSTNVEVGNTNGSSLATANNSVFTRLPKLQLPHFKGNVTKWNSFWDSFKSSVHSNEAISTIDKYNYLNSLLEGPAARAIQGLALTEANYESAIQLLQARFGKPQQVISAHMDELLRLPSCTGDKSSSLRYVYDKISVHVRGLQALGVSSKEYGSLLIPILMSKLPSDLRMRIARESKGDTWNIDELLEILRVETEVREASERFKVGEPPKKQSDGPRTYPPSMGKTLFSQESDEFKIRCAFCDAPHYSASCQVVTDAVKRKEILMKAKRCFNCLRPGHGVKNCRNPKNCRNCGARHHQSICSKIYTPTSIPENKDKNREEKHDVDTKAADSKACTITAGSQVKNRKHVLLQTARAIATNEDGSKTTTARILFDTGSQRSYITDDLRRRLGLNAIKTETLHLNTFGDNKHQRKSCQVFNVSLRGRNGEEMQISALNFPVICSPLPTSIDLHDYPHLRELDLADLPESSNTQDSIDILVGSDYYWDFVTGEALHGDSGPTAVNSIFGWMLSGNAESINDKGRKHEGTSANLIISRTEDFVTNDTKDDQLVDALRHFWETESIGIKYGGDVDMQASPEDFIEEISFNGQNYEVGLPWKGDRFPRSDGYDMCHNRLNSLHRRLRTDPVLLSEYDKIIREQLQTGIIERVPDTTDDENRVNYLPHHPVIRRDKDTTKIRVVYDGSAKNSKEDDSLNDCLKTGPNFTPHVFDSLVKFRWNSIGITADVEKAFLMIGIRSKDRDALRFLWFDDPNECHPNLAIYRFKRLVFGLRPSPSILGSIISHHLERYSHSDPKIIPLLKESFYVDDLVTGENDLDESFHIYKRSKEIMAEGGFNLRKWYSNSQVLMDRINAHEHETENSTNTPQPENINLRENIPQTLQEDESYAKLATGQNGTDLFGGSVKVLGNNWDTKADEMFFQFERWKEEASSISPTKRSLLMLTAKIFDPLGLLAPLTISLKILFQILCTERVDWDDPLTGESLLKFQTIIREISCLHSVRVPRCYFDTNSETVEVELHGFSDASSQAYSAVVYIRSVDQNDNIRVQLVACKTRVAPLKRQSIPRLELLGAVLLARLCDKIMRTVGELVTTYWVDSMTTLCWIRNDKHWKQYVQHRVNEVRKLSSKSAWRYCPGAQNPADQPSRGLDPKELAENETWWHGPQFLQKSRNEWPLENPSTKNDDVADQEAVQIPPCVTHIMLTNDTSGLETRVDEIMNIERYGSLQTLLRVTANVFRFIRRLKSRTTSKVAVEPTGNDIVEDIKLAERLWVQATQRCCFPEEIKLLSKLRNVTVNSKSKIQQFGLYLDEDGVLRCGGRVAASSLPSSSKNPIFLPTKHPFVRLLVLHTHNQIKHSGVRDTLTTLRERYWILRGREVVKNIIRHCVGCSRYHGVPFKSQPTPDLPVTRVSDDPPFSHVGLDFAGPLFIRPNKPSDSPEGDVNNSSSMKVYVLLLTCASTRAVHLELTLGLSVQAFLLAFRRFASRRGLPATITSDNAKAFKSSSKDVSKIIRSQEVWHYLAERRIQWHFIVEHAPWWGGFWERLVRSVKSPLKRVVGRSTLTYDELHTILIEIEGIINARPLTYVYDDEEMNYEPLTPSHLIYGRRITSSPNSSHHEVISTNRALTRRCRHHKHLLEQLTKQWRREYLTSLREQSSLKSKARGSSSCISEGDIVIVKNDSAPRAFWKLARIEQLLPGKDGKVRSASIRVGSNQGNSSSTRRPIEHLIPIEVKAGAADIPSTKDCSVNEETVLKNESTRERRTAAVVGELRRRDGDFH